MLKINFINTLVFRINSNIITVFLHIVVLTVTILNALIYHIHF